MTNEDYRLIDSKFVVERRRYDEGHGGSIPDDYDVKNNQLICCTTSSQGQAQWVCDRLNELRIYKLEELLQDAKAN